ncbi:uroporphyrinogen-III synthase [Oerskovia sp. NPDC060287]|uniref:uroporphyrinogen-III synthase n=1 Tax=Oerskovia sp. NPDC060287 TaxID=3347095 RepID=UPI00366273D1
MPGRLRDPQRGRELPPVQSSPQHSGAAGPLTGTTVLVPRSPERAEPLAVRLRTQGATVLVSPAIERAPIEDTAAMDAAVADLARGAFAWVVVTSVNAIDELTASAARRGRSLAEVSGRDRAAGTAGPGTRWAAVGPATRRALEAAGVRVDLEATVNSARGLLAAFDRLPDARGAGVRSASDGGPAGARGRVLVPQGDLAKPTMADGLRERAWDVQVVTAYRTVSHALSPEVVEAWRAGAVDVVVLTSGSVAREVAAQLGADPRVAGVAIGEPTAEAAHAVGLRVDAVADRATDEALAAAVLRVAADPSARPRDTPPAPLLDSDSPSPTEGRNLP